MRIRGIDSIRFVCALVVVIGHFGLPIPALISSLPGLPGKIINGLIGIAFNGPAAVIVFFVVSGFCIHFPNRVKHQLDLGSYYAKRMIRILLPAFVAVAIYLALGAQLLPPGYWMFWSIICEVVYYLIYPLLLQLRNRYSWVSIILVSTMTFLVTCAVNMDAIRESHNAYNPLDLLTWVVGLPCWLIGCWLAENYQRFRSLSTTQMWSLRVIVFGISSLLRAYKFHGTSLLANSIFHLNLFGLLICVWLGYEIMYFQRKQPASWLEWAGRWSYSLYMIHPLVPTVLRKLGFANLAEAQFRIACLLVALVLSYVFFRIVELPAHRLAQWAGAILKPANHRPQIKKFQNAYGLSMLFLLLLKNLFQRRRLMPPGGSALVDEHYRPIPIKATIFMDQSPNEHSEQPVDAQLS